MRIFATFQGYEVDPVTKDRATEEVGRERLIEVDTFGEQLVKFSIDDKPAFLANREDVERALAACKAGNGRLF